MWEGDCLIVCCACPGWLTLTKQRLSNTTVATPSCYSLPAHLLEASQVHGFEVSELGLQLVEGARHGLRWRSGWQGAGHCVGSAEQEQ